MNMHKDKERLRHRNHVKLLNEAMNNVPKSLHDSQTKVRKLRHLVLYYRYMRMVHAECTKGTSVVSGDVKKYVKKKTRKSIHKPVQTPSKKTPRAHIVFLQVDKSGNLKEDTEKHILNEKNHIVYDNYHDSSIANSEYKVPQVVMVDGIFDNVFPNQGTPLPLENYHDVQPNMYNSISHDKCDLEYRISDKKICDDEKENYSPNATNTSIINSSNQVMNTSSVYNMQRFSPTNIDNVEDLMLNKHQKINIQNILQDYSDTSILKDFTFLNPINEGFHTDVNRPEQNAEYLLEASPFQNIPDYLMNNPSRNYQNTVLSEENLSFKQYYYFDPTSAESQFFGLSSASVNVSENSSSSCSMLTDKLNIDLEDVSDSSSDFCTNFAASSNSFRVENIVCDSSQTSSDNLPYKTTLGYKEFENNYFLPIFSSDPNCIENIARNRILLHPTVSTMSVGPYVISKPHPENIFPTNVSINENLQTLHSSKSVPMYQDAFIESRFLNDTVSLYSPSFGENLQFSEFPLLQPKVEVINSDDCTEFVTQDTKCPFSDEASLSLFEYIDSC